MKTEKGEFERGHGFPSQRFHTFPPINGSYRLQAVCRDTDATWKRSPMLSWKSTVSGISAPKGKNSRASLVAVCRTDPSRTRMKATGATYKGQGDQESNLVISR